MKILEDIEITFSYPVPTLVGTVELSITCSGDGDLMSTSFISSCIGLHLIVAKAKPLISSLMECSSWPEGYQFCGIE